MAQMIPAREYTDFHNSLAEKKVFQAFEDHMPDSYRVYHSENWFRAPNQHISDQPRGEIDFLIAHKEKGLLVLEIKGGGIEYDATKDDWWTVGRKGRDRLDKSPAIQANAGMYNLINRLKENKKVCEGKYFPGVIGWGLFFPDLSRDDAGEFPDMEIPRERILFKEDLESLEKSIETLYQFWENQHTATGPLSSEQWEALTGSFLRRKFQVLESMGHFIEKNERTLYRLTEEQKQLLDFLGEHRDVFIRGCAGSGKTLLSIEKARRLARRGIKTLWLCYNKKLSNHVEKSFPEESFTARHFHSFAHGYIREAGLQIPFPDDEATAEEWQNFWDNTIPSLLTRASEDNRERYQALIVDEGQDFYDNWFFSLLNVLEEDRYLYVFYDPNQSVYRKLPGWLEEHRREFYSLTRNVRNTQEIGEASLLLGDIEEEIDLGPEGLPVKVDYVEQDKQIPGTLHLAFNKLFNEDNLSTDQAVVLTRRSPENSIFSDLRNLGEFQLMEENDGNEKQVIHSTIRSFKGLEADVVFLINPRMDVAHRKDFYIGASRAKHLLWIITTDPKIKEKI